MVCGWWCSTSNTIGGCGAPAKRSLIPAAMARTCFFFSSRRQHRMWLVVTGVQTCALPISVPDGSAQKETLYQIRGVTEAFRPEAFTLDAAQNCYTCPAGKSLPYQRKNVLPGQTKYIYQAAKQDCQDCAYRSQCCPKSQNGRSLVRAEDSPEVEAFRAKMETEAAKTLYKKRGAVAEFPHLWIKEKFGMRRFSVRGLQKVNIEGLWLAVTFNIQQWIRLCWKPQRL